PDLQSTSDPRVSIFGKFGMASGQDDSHSRSPSIASSSAKSSALPPPFDSASSNISGPRQSTRRPHSVVYDPTLSGNLVGAYDSNKVSSHNSRSSSRCNQSDADGRSSTRRTTVSGTSASPSISIRANVVDPARNRSASRGSRISDGSSYNARRYSLRNSPKSISFISGQDNVDLDDSSDDEENGNSTPAASVPAAYRQTHGSMAGIDHQPTIAAGVHLSFPRSPSSAGAPATGSESGSLGYRGMRSDGLGRRRGSIRSGFYASNEGLSVETAPIDPASTSAAAASNTSSAAASPTATRAARPMSFRRAGAVVPVPTPVTIPDVQRSLSSSGGLAPRPQHPGRNRSLSQTPTSRSPVLPVAAAEPRHLSVDALHHDTESASGSSDAHQSTSGTLVSSLMRKPTCVAVLAGCGHLDDTLVKATEADIPPDELGDSVGREGSYTTQARLSAASMVVESVFKGVDACKVLSSVEYERCSLEAASLKSRLQSTRTRLALEVRMRDAAKNLVDLHKGSGVGVSMFKGKHSHQAHVDEYNQANEKVQQAEVDIAELSVKLRLLESSIHGHQLAVLSSAIRTVVSESAHASEQAQVAEKSLGLRVAALERQVEDIKTANSQETEKLVSGHIATRQELEQQIRDLQNKNHEALARFASKEADTLGTESHLSRHSTSLAVERLAGEITVLKEQKHDSEQRVRALEAKLDDAHLKTQEARNALDELRSQASDVAEVSRAKLESAMSDAHLQAQSVRAFVTGIKNIVGPLRVLADVQDNTEKLRSFNGNDLAHSQTPPATPTLRMDSAPSKEMTSVESLDSYLAGGKEGAANGNWNADKVASVMALIGATVSSCSTFYQESTRVYESCVRLKKELSTEKRLREAQGLAISQQRDKLTKANYLVESADQRVKEATESLLAEHANEKKRWSEERQRLFDNIERLTQDINSLKSVDVALPSSDSHLQPLASTPSPGYVANAPVARSTGDTAIGNIEALSGGEPSENSKLRAELDRLQAQVLELHADIASARQQLQSRIDEVNELREELATAKLESEQVPALESRIEILQKAELSMRKQLAELDPLKQANAGLLRMLEEANYKAGSSTSSRLTRCRSLTSLDSLRSPSMISRTDAQTMTDFDMKSGSGATTDEEVSQMLMVYSEKLVLKEDALHTREDELEAVRVTAAEIEYVLQHMLASAESLLQSAATNGARKSLSESISPSSSSWSPAYSAQLKPDTRNRSASFFQGLRTNYLGMVDSSDMPSPTQRAQTEPQRPAFQSHKARMELLKTKEQLSSLQKHWAVRSKHEEAVQEDIAHVLGQISRLRAKVVGLEDEKARREEEARRLDARCRELENQNAEQVLQLIVDRIGKRELETKRMSDNPPNGALATSSQASDSPDGSLSTESALRSRHVSMNSTVTISHPEAGDIRTEFNELLHQIIARRDEDIERIQAVADAWRVDARKALQSNEQRRWNTCTRGTQTASVDQ
ncbi:hypothetical protein EV175_002290, partial [Coemansia sp. RSA 1933]